MSTLYIEDNRKIITFTDDTVYNLGYWIVKRPYEYGEAPDNIITNGESMLTVNALACLDNNGVYHGLNGVKIDNNGNTYEGNPSGKWVKITGVNGGSYTVQLSNSTQVVALSSAPVDFIGSQDDIKAGDIILITGNYYNYNTTTTYESSSFNENSIDIDDLTEWSSVYYHNADNTNRKIIFITVFGDVINNSGFLDVAAISKYDAGIYADIIASNVFSNSLGSDSTRKLSALISGYEEPVGQTNDDPYGDGGSTSTGGGGGTFDPSGDVVDVPSLPLLSALDTGFVTMWRPTKTELKDLYNYLWSSAFDLESFKKIFANPMDTFLGFGIIPLNPTISGQSELKVGNIGTGINLSRIGNQYYEIDCGSVDIPEFFGSYLDYEPYSTLDLFLPYIGSIPISIDDVRTNPPNQGSIKVVYHVDILSGSCVAFIRCKNKNGIWTTCYQYNGSVFTPLPITGNDFTSLYQGVLSAVGSAVGLATNIGSKNFGGAIGNAANIAGSVMNSKPTINRSGSMGSSGGRLGSQAPYLIMNLPKQAVAFAQNTFTGYPAHITNSVRSLTGYTEFEQIWIEKVPATESELSEIESILTSGVIL